MRRDQRLYRQHDTCFCSCSFCSWESTLEEWVPTEICRSYRTERQLSQEDMISRDFSVRHWQMIEAGRPVTVTTLLRICGTFNLTLEQLFAGLSDHLRKRRGE